MTNPIQEYVRDLDTDDILSIVSEWEEYEKSFGKIDHDGKLIRHVSAIIVLVEGTHSLWKVWLDKLMIEVFRELANRYREMCETYKAG